MLENGTPMTYCSPTILKLSIEYWVAREGRLHLVTDPVDSFTLGLHSYPQTLIWFFDESPTSEVSKPGCDIETEQPPAKEQLTGASIAVTVGVFTNVAVV